MEQILGVGAVAIGTRPCDGECSFLFYLFLQESNGACQEKMMEQGFTTASGFSLLEMGEMRTFGFSFVAGDDAVSTQGAGVCPSLFGFVNVKDAPFFVTSSGV